LVIVENLLPPVFDPAREPIFLMRGWWKLQICWPKQLCPSRFDTVNSGPHRCHELATRDSFRFC